MEICQTGGMKVCVSLGGRHACGRRTARVERKDGTCVADGRHACGRMSGTHERAGCLSVPTHETPKALQGIPGLGRVGEAMQGFLSL